MQARCRRFDPDQLHTFFRKYSETFFDKCIRRVETSIFAESSQANELSIRVAHSNEMNVSFRFAAKSGSLDLDLEFRQSIFRWGVKEIEVSKLLRACGGCLGAQRR